MIMLVMPSDADGLVIPAARPAEAWSAVMALTHAERAAADAGHRLAATGSVAQVWSGRAAQDYRARRADLAGRLAELTAVARVAAAVIRVWALDADAATAAMRAARDGIEQATARVEGARAAGRYWAPELTADLDRAWEAWGRAKQAYWDGTGRAASRLLAVRDLVSGRPEDGADQLRGFYHELRDGLVVEPAALAWGLTGEALVDRDRWWGNVSGLPVRAWSGLTDTVRHPLDAVAGAVDADGWQHGRYGEAAATVAVSFLPRSQVLRFGREGGAAHYARAVLDRGAPKPRLQTVDEMLAGVDLTQHEHAEYGHTISRHVAVDDGYLADRLAHGTLVDGGGRGFVPREASRFTDLAAADRMVTEALRSNEARLRAFATGAGPPTAAFRLTGAQAAGVVMSARGGGFALRDSASVVVRMARGPEGPYVVSAYLE